MSDMEIEGTAIPNSTLLNIQANAKDVEFNNNYIETKGNISDLGAVLVPGFNFIKIANGARAIQEHNTIWMNGFVPITPPSNAVVNNSADVTNKIESQATGTPTLTNCGTSASLASGSNGTSGRIREGSGAPTGCTLNFAAPIRTVPPVCVLFNTQGSFPLTMNTSTVSAITYTHAAGSMTVNYQCTPY